MNIIVGIPFYSDFEFCKDTLKEFRKNCFEVVKRELFQLNGDSFFIRPVFGILPYNRNYVVMGSQTIGRMEKNMDAVMFIDSDTRGTFNDILSLMHSGKDIISGSYKMHRTLDIDVWEVDPEGNKTRSYFVNELSGVQPVGATGLGFTFIARKVFDAMKPLWFYFPRMESGVVVGEDIMFCLNAKKAGFQTYCDFDIVVEHKERTVSSFDWNF
jgi:hypothetical protein